MSTKKKTKAKAKGAFHTPGNLIEAVDPPFSVALRASDAPSFKTIYDAAMGACAPLADALEMARTKAATFTGADKATVDGIVGKISTVLMSLGGVCGSLMVADDALES